MSMFTLPDLQALHDMQVGLDLMVMNLAKDFLPFFVAFGAADAAQSLTNAFDAAHADYIQLVGIDPGIALA